MRIPKVNTLCWLYLITSLVQCDAFKILVLCPIPAGSHRIQGHAIINHLLKAGHEVTYITPYLQNHTNPNLRQISVEDNISALNTTLINVQYLMKRTIEIDQEIIFHMMINITQKTLENDHVLNLLNDPKEQFDAVIAQWTFNEIYSGFAAAFNCPYMWFIPYEPNFVSLGLIDEATNPAYTANNEVMDVPPFTFWQRVKSLQFQTMITLRKYLYFRSLEEKLYSETFKPILAKKNRSLPPYEEIRLNASLILASYHVSLGQALRLPQNYIPIAGQHIDEDVAPLPKDLKKIMDESKNGVIYFSMGSNMKSRDLPETIKRNLLKMFSGLKQTIIWKFEEPLPNLPKHIHIMNWAPQHSILAHPRCVLFISHGGLLSTNEAIHFGVPLVSIPVYYDQLYNADKSTKRGIGIKVTLSENIAYDLKNAIQEMLNNPKYRERIKEASFVYHHRTATPGKELVHWVEHVVYTRGALHLRSPALLLPWYQKMYLDLAAIVLIMFLLILFCLRKLKKKLKYFYRIKTKLS